MSIHQTTPEFSATFKYVCVPQNLAADTRRINTNDCPDTEGNIAPRELALENHWLLQHTPYHYAIQDIVHHGHAINATQPISNRLSDRTLVVTFLQTYGLCNANQPKGAWASARYFVRFLLAYGHMHMRTEVIRRLRLRAAKSSLPTSVPTVPSAKPAHKSAMPEDLRTKQEGEGV